MGDATSRGSNVVAAHMVKDVEHKARSSRTEERDHTNQESEVATTSAGQRMADAARTWLESLDPAQLMQATHPWPSDSERHRWFYTPTDHGGLPLLEMTPVQQGLAMQVLASGLSAAGYVTATTVMGLENVLDQVEGWGVTWGRERGRDPQLYWLTVFGEPDPAGTWSWRFGGHHVSVHHTIVGGKPESSTPCFLGADPAESPLLGGHVLRPLGAAEDLARDLMRSLDEEQASRALLHPVAPVDLVGGNRVRLGDGDTVVPLADLWRGRFVDPSLSERVDAMQRGAEAKAGVTAGHLEAVAFSARPKGIAAAELSAEQRDQLSRILHVFIDRVPHEIADREAAKFSGDNLLDVHFAWAGGLERGEPHYYRMQAPRLLAEYDNTQRDANHIHTVWRDPQADFGRDPLGDHLAVAHR